MFIAAIGVDVGGLGHRELVIFQGAKSAPKAWSPRDKAT
jgi:hypothetical protein